MRRTLVFVTLPCTRCVTLSKRLVNTAHLNAAITLVTTVAIQQWLGRSHSPPTPGTSVPVPKDAERHWDVNIILFTDTPTSQHNISTRNNSHNFFLCFRRCSDLWSLDLESMLYQLSNVPRDPLENIDHSDLSLHPPWEGQPYPNRGAHTSFLSFLLPFFYSFFFNSHHQHHYHLCVCCLFFGGFFSEEHIPSPNHRYHPREIDVKPYRAGHIPGTHTG